MFLRNPAPAVSSFIVREIYIEKEIGASVYAPSFIEDCEPAVKKLQEEYGFEYTVEYVK